MAAAEIAIGPTGAVLDVRALRVDVRGASGSATAVRDVSFDVQPGTRLGLVGESGSGKSLTSLAIMRLLPPAARVAGGGVFLHGRNLLGLSEREMTAIRGRDVAMVYQNPLSALNPIQTIGRQLSEAVRAHAHLSRAAARRRAVELLGEVGVPDPARRAGSYPHEFSGGMRQRVVIAMAIAGDPALLIADEPTTALDVTTQARIIQLLDDLVDQRNCAVLLITHDLGLAASFCSELLVMYAGRIVERATADTFSRQPAHPYSEALLASVCRLDSDPDAAIPAIGGQPPVPGRVPPGCAFHPRCPIAQRVCSEREPELLPHPPVSGLAACHFAAERVGHLGGVS